MTVKYKLARFKVSWRDRLDFLNHLLQSHLPELKVHAYFAPVTPPPSVGGGRQRYCRCCVILWQNNGRRESCEQRSIRNVIFFHFVFLMFLNNNDNFRDMSCHFLHERLKSCAFFHFFFRLAFNELIAELNIEISPLQLIYSMNMS